MSNGMIGNAAVVTIQEGTNTSVTTLGDVFNVDISNTRDSIDISTFDSPNKTREFMPGLIDPGELTLSLNYDGKDGGNANTLETQRTATAMTWKIRFNDNTNTSNCSHFSCDAFITRLGYAVPNDGKVAQDVTIKLTGAPTFTDQT